MKGWKTPLRAKEAQTEADTCAAMWAGTCTQGKWRRAAKAMVRQLFFNNQLVTKENDYHTKKKKKKKKKKK
jgi:hypothetical protein